MGAGRDGTRRVATPMPRGAVICPFYERPIVKVTRRRAALAELFHRKRRTMRHFYDNAKTKVEPRVWMKL